METKERRAYAVKKRVVYFVGFLFIAIPVAVGVLVWYFMPKCDDTSNNAGNSGANQGGSGSSTIVTSIPTTTIGTTAAPSPTEPWKNLRLSRDVLPVHYDITLYPDFYDGKSWFYGNETIEIKVHKRTSFILIHYKFLNMTRTTLRDANKNDIGIKTPRGYDENEFWIIETTSPLQENSTVFLEIEFNGSLLRSIVGFYKSSYVNSITNKTSYLVSSKFEPVSARRAFPCFDEPNIKATYTVHLVHRQGYTALSNMPEEVTKQWSEDPSLYKTDFKTSVKMSTYLVCFIVCDFDYLTNTTKHGIKVRTFATPDRVNQTQFSLNVAVHTMELYQDLFNVTYPLPKQDMIGIPNFVSGAMEHWGLITYREVNMLYDPDEASSANLQRVAVVVAHEISHQWFGNIVTMDWWDDLWLNEGFASFMEYIGTDSFKPDWKMLEQFPSEDAQPVMVTDSKVSSHPIIVNVQNPNQINEVFDSISYSKGASVIAMLEGIMGKDKFFTGVGKYLTQHKWANAKTDDLWSALGNVVETEPKLSVKDMMDTWTRQMGLPYINITSVSSTGSTTTFKAVQKRFLADISTHYDENESPYKYKWYVYLDYETGGGVRDFQWMKKQDEITFTVPADISKSWIKFNVNQTGFYRVLYPNDLWQKFANQLQQDTNILSGVDKSGLIDDAFNLARGGYLGYDVALELTKYLDKEMDHLPWESVTSGLAYIQDMFENGGDFSGFRKYVLSKVKPVLDKIGWDDKGDHLQKLMRTNIIELACNLGDLECLQNATEKFVNWIHNNQSIPPNLRSLVYKYGIQNSNSESDWNFMWNKYLTETVPQEQTKLLYGLSRTRTVWLLMRYLQYTKDTSKVKDQDFFIVLTYIARNPVGRSLVWDWTRANWQYMVDRFTVFSRSFGRLVPSIVSNFNTQFKLSEVEAFFKQYPEAGAGERGREQALESIRGNIAWMNKYQSIISSWLNQQ